MLWRTASFEFLALKTWTLDHGPLAGECLSTPVCQCKKRSNRKQMIARSLEIDEQHDQWSLSLHLTQVLPKGISPARQIYLNGLDHMSQIRASITTMTTWRRVPTCKAKQACSLIACSSCAVVCFNNVILNPSIPLHWFNTVKDSPDCVSC